MALLAIWLILMTAGQTLLANFSFIILARVCSLPAPLLMLYAIIFDVLHFAGIGPASIAMALAPCFTIEKKTPNSHALLQAAQFGVVYTALYLLSIRIFSYG